MRRECSNLGARPSGVRLNQVPCSSRPRHAHTPTRFAPPPPAPTPMIEKSKPCAGGVVRGGGPKPDGGRESVAAAARLPHRAVRRW